MEKTTIAGKCKFCGKYNMLSCKKLYETDPDVRADFKESIDSGNISLISVTTKEAQDNFGYCSTIDDAYELQSLLWKDEPPLPVECYKKLMAKANEHKIPFSQVWNAFVYRLFVEAGLHQTKHDRPDEVYIYLVPLDGFTFEFGDLSVWIQETSSDGEVYFLNFTLKIGQVKIEKRGILSSELDITKTCEAHPIALGFSDYSQTVLWTMLSFVMEFAKPYYQYELGYTEKFQTKASKAGQRTLF